MRSPWTLSTIEALIFIAFVTVVAGAGTWVSVEPSRPIEQTAPPIEAPLAAVAALH